MSTTPCKDNLYSHAENTVIPIFPPSTQNLAAQKIEQAVFRNGTFNPSQATRQCLEEEFRRADPTAYKRDIKSRVQKWVQGAFDLQFATGELLEDMVLYLQQLKTDQQTVLAKPNSITYTDEISLLIEDLKKIQAQSSNLFPEQLDCIEPKILQQAFVDLRQFEKHLLELFNESEQSDTPLTEESPSDFLAFCELMKECSGTMRSFGTELREFLVATILQK